MLTIVKRKYLLPAFALFVALSITGTNNFYEFRVNNELSKQVNSQEFFNKDFIHTPQQAKVLVTASTEELLGSYEIELTDVKNKDLYTKTIDGTQCYIYAFNSKLKLTRSGKAYLVDFSSSIILNKSKLSFNIISTENLKQDILKEILLLENSVNDKNNVSSDKAYLVYQNESLDIKIDYPDYWSYTNNQNTSNNTVTDTVSFYIGDDKTSDYVRISLSTNSRTTPDSVITKLTKQNYKQSNNSFINISGIEFAILEQTFNKNSVESKEMVYISKNKYKSIGLLVVTVKLSANHNTPDVQSDIKNVLNSIR